MKDLSSFLLLSFKMKKGFKNFLCTSDLKTSPHHHHEFFKFDRHQPTLEEMIIQLDLEDKMATADRLLHHRMSCVNSSDIFPTARNPLNQYHPRFSLDGRDAMYRSSFRNFEHVPARSAGRCLPPKVAGERVIWCKPGVVGKLMGLEAMSIPIRLSHKMKSTLLRRQNLRRSSEMARRKVYSNRGGATARYRIMKPVAAEITAARDEAGNWPARRFL